LIIGNPARFGVESAVTEFFEEPGLRALGCFVLHIEGTRYGVCEPDATMLANSFDEVRRRITNRGTHLAPFVKEDGMQIAVSVIRSLYTDVDKGTTFFDLSSSDFGRLIHRNRLLWAPDGDEAFDDRSFVLQFDAADRVRLIAFRRGLDADVLLNMRDVWMLSDHFYSILEEWHRRFEADWRLAIGSSSRA
jgi:hypothetical protein